ncbi:hypothetical protein K440DRAFT_643935 [Wilcoxina mikolae CBS 423.85]|nr:hypothetical protein K440DRAFT_643935 [Wilcoxina mikolae CBS 423.85]
MSALEVINAILDLLFQLSPALDRVLEDLSSPKFNNPSIFSSALDLVPKDLTSPTRDDPDISSPAEELPDFLVVSVTSGRQTQHPKQHSQGDTKADLPVEFGKLKRQDSNSESHVPQGKSLLLMSDRLHLEEKTVGDGLLIGRYDGKQVLVEVVSHTGNEMSRSQGEQHMQLKAESFHQLSKTGSFCILDCLGFVISTSDTGTSISTLVNCIKELHTLGWSHRSISSATVVFCKEEGGASVLWNVLKNPYSVDFRYSRPSEKAGKTDQTEKPATNSAWQHYQHPEYTTSESFRETYDYCSIGILLLELGSWTKLDVYLAHNAALKSKRLAFRDVLINKYAPRLSYLMGVVYTDVTLACLQGDFGQAPESTEGQTVVFQFYDKVVGPLKELCAPI